LSTPSLVTVRRLFVCSKKSASPGYISVFLNIWTSC